MKTKSIIPIIATLAAGGFGLYLAATFSQWTLWLIICLYGVSALAS